MCISDGSTSQPLCNGLWHSQRLNTQLLTFFHVTELTEGLVPDAVHDILEGCAEYEVKELLKYLRANQNIPVTVEYINASNLPHAPLNVGDKPSAISDVFYGSSGHSLKQKV